MADAKYIFVFVICFLETVKAVPPEACFAEFRWDDCGKPPVPVMYYWKPGSRCEVGMWRGCFPNPNMFQDEYQCVSSCIFSVRAMADDYHNKLILNEDTMLTEEHPNETTTVTESGLEETTVAGAGEGNSTVTEAQGNVTSVEESMNATNAHSATTVAAVVEAASNKTH